MAVMAELKFGRTTPAELKFGPASGSTFRAPQFTSRISAHDGFGGGAPVRMASSAACAMKA